MQKHFYLPEPQTDFIFAIFAEEFGFIGCCILITLFLMVIYQGVKIAKNSSDPYLCYVAIGLISLFAIQVMINLGVVVGLFPVTGITLPLYILRRQLACGHDGQHGALDEHCKMKS